MSRIIKEKCRLCGEIKPLTFEHVPPKSAFNNRSVKLITGHELFKEEYENRLPWEDEGLYGKIQQKGRGGDYLCQECNNNVGSWYVPGYLKFIQIVGAASKQSWKSGEDHLRI